MFVKTRIIGIGNPLRGDDGVGVVLAQRLQGETLPQGVEVIDGGLGGMALIDCFEDVSRVILVDAADFGAPPGEFRVFDLHDLPLEETAGAQQLHAGIVPLLALVRQLELCPQVQLVVVQVADTTIPFSLSPPVEEALPWIADALRALL